MTGYENCFYKIYQRITTINKTFRNCEKNSTSKLKYD